MFQHVYILMRPEMEIMEISNTAKRFLVSLYNVSRPVLSNPLSHNSRVIASILQYLYKQNHVICTSWGVGTLTFFTSHNYFETDPFCCMYQLFICIVAYSSILWIYHSCLLPICQLVDIQVVSSFGLSQIKLL